MQVFLVIQGHPFHIQRDTAEECLVLARNWAWACHHWKLTFTFQPSTGKVFSNPGASDIPCGMLFREGYPLEPKKGGDVVRDLFGRLHKALVIQKTSGLDEARLACTEREPKSDFAKLYPWRQIVRAAGQAHVEGEVWCEVCFPNTKLPDLSGHGAQTRSE